MKKRVLFLSAAGIAAGLVFALESNRRKRLASGASVSDGESLAKKKPSEISGAKSETPLDDRGTDQAAASYILKDIRDTAFDASDEKLALALGRPTEEIVQGINGDGLIDGDVVMKARALAMQRGMEME